MLAVNDNQPTLHENLARVFADAAKKGWRDASHETHAESDQGRALQCKVRVRGFRDTPNREVYMDDHAE